jgi:hypothetical protein
MADDNRELHEVDLVCARLAERFPHLSPESIRATVDEIHAGLDGPIRDFVPVLVEHLARDRFSATAPSRLASAGA